MLPTSEDVGKPRQRRRYRRRAIVLLDVVSVTVYMTMVERSQVVAPIACPGGCDDGKWGQHSRFSRQWVDYDCVAYTIVILRVRCSACRVVWSLFPALVWYRFRFCYRLVQAAIWSMLEGKSSTKVAQSLLARLSPMAESRSQVTSASTICSWMNWLGQPCLEVFVRWTVSVIARGDPEAARALVAALEIQRGLSGAVGVRERAKRFLLICVGLDAVVKRRSDLFRRSPYQLRDWAWVLFRERRCVLARPP